MPYPTTNSSSMTKQVYSGSIGTSRRSGLSRRVTIFTLGGSAGIEQFFQVVKGISRIDDIFHDQHVPPGNIRREVLSHFQSARRSGPRSVRGNGHKVEFQRRLHTADKVGKKDDAALQNTDDDGRLPS